MVALIIGEPAKHLKLVEHCHHVVFVLRVSRVGAIEHDCLIECFLGFSDFTKSELRLEKSFVNSRKSVINSDASLAIFDGQFPLLLGQVDGRSVRVHLDSWLDGDGLRVT